MDTTKKKRAIKYLGLLCPHCSDIIYSRSRHDFRYCACMYCSVDGGREYFRVGWGGDQFKEPWIVPLAVEIKVLAKVK